MSLLTQVQSMEQHTKDIYQALQAQGFTLPTQLNIQNIAATVRSEFAQTKSI